MATTTTTLDLYRGNFAGRDNPGAVFETSNIEDPEVMPLVPPVHVGPRRAWWFQRFREWIGIRIQRNPVMQALCCCTTESYEDLLIMRRRDAAVRKELLFQPRYLGREDIVEVALDHVERAGYHMRIDTDPDGVRVDNVAQFVPRFVASVTNAVRSKIGQRPMGTPGNAELVEREALRIMRDYRVKQTDIVGHLPYIVRCYFNEDVQYKLPTHEARMTRFERWFYRDTRPSGVFTVTA